MPLANHTHSSAREFTRLLTVLRNKGQSVLNDISKATETTLFRFEQGLSALNSRRQRAARVHSADVVKPSSIQFVAAAF
jgi:hypothetical protein